MDYVYFLISALLSTIFLFVRHKYSYWKQRNVPHVTPVFPLGNLNGLKCFMMREKLNDLYIKFRCTSKIAGVYLFLKPAVVALDLDLIKSILIKDFSVFTDRLQFSNPTHDPVTANLFNLAGSKWRRMRTKLSPTFTSGKMKFMFPTVVGVATELDAAMSSELDKSDTVEIRQLLARFTTDVIGTSVFGIQCNSLKDPAVEFLTFGRRVMEQPYKPSLLRHFLATYSKLGVLLRIKVQEPTLTNFFTTVIKETIALREANNIQRNDFMNLLIELKNQSDGDGGLTIEEIIAQSFVFFAAGFETSASNMSFTLFELAKHPTIQDKVREEILQILKKHNNELSYEAMSEMTYLSQCVNEIIRKYPALVYLTRKANEDYPIPDTELVIEKGTPVLIPVWSIHYDPEIYPNPTKFDPDRFSGENIASRDAMTFLGFGDGPRNCIGLRFGRMQVGIGLITLLRSFKFSVAENTPQEIALNPKSFVLMPRDGLWLKVEAI